MKYYLEILIILSYTYLKGPVSFKKKLSSSLSWNDVGCSAPKSIEGQ